MKRVVLFTAMIIGSGIASAAVYKWTDADGKVHYGDVPPDGVKAEVVEMLGSRAPSAPAAQPARSPAASPSSSAAAAAAAAQAAKDKPAVDPADAAAARAEQCTSAQARLKQLQEGRHLFRPGANGEREYLTSEQIDSERADAQKEVDTVCAGVSQN